MILNTYFNQYGLMIFENRKYYMIMFNGLYLKLKSKKINPNEFDISKFYEMVNGSRKHSQNWF